MIRHSGIRDSGARFQIVPSTRRIIVPTACKTIGVVGDINSEQLTFQCPKEIDGHDIKGCGEHRVTWTNANNEMGHDHLELIEEDDESLYFSWTVRGETTTMAGIVSFSIHFEDVNESGTPVYHWGTAECAECEILDSVNAVIGAFKNIYVDAGTLVFADHAPVHDAELMLQTPGIVPNGRKPIYTNGVHDVAGYASVDVAVSSERPPIIEVQDGGLIVATDGTPQNMTTLQLDAPTIEVTDDGIVKASTHGMLTEHRLGATDDADFIPENIRFGKTVFGIDGSYVSKIKVKLTVSDSATYGIRYWAYSSTGFTQLYHNYANNFPNAIPEGTTYEFDTSPGSVIIIDHMGDFSCGAFSMIYDDVNETTTGYTKMYTKVYMISSSAATKQVDAEIR